MYWAVKDGSTYSKFYSIPSFYLRLWHYLPRNDRRSKKASVKLNAASWYNVSLFSSWKEPTLPVWATFLCVRRHYLRVVWVDWQKLFDMHSREKLLRRWNSFTVNSKAPADRTSASRSVVSRKLMVGGSEVLVSRGDGKGAGETGSKQRRQTFEEWNTGRRTSKYFARFSLSVEFPTTPTQPNRCYCWYL